MRALTVVVMTLALILGSANVAFAFHGYATAYETGYVNHYTGIEVTRVDRSITQGNNGCGGYYTGSPLYQTEWVLITSNAQNWIELGTGHQCQDTIRYWYWGYGYLGDWYPQGELANRTAGQTHTFRIGRSNGNLWRYRVDGNIQDSLTWADQGAQISTGLESYGSAAEVASYSSYDLKYALDEGPFTSWSGYDNKLVDPTPEMCGGWNSTTSWRAAENRSC